MNIEVKILERMDFILETVPRLESVLVGIMNQVEPDSVPAEELYRIFNKTLSLYVTLLEVLRKFMLYFPAEDVKVSIACLKGFSALNKESKAEVLKFMETLS